MLKPIQARDLIGRLVEYAYHSGLTMDEIVAELRKSMIEFTLEMESGNQCKVAKRIGVHRNTLNRDMKMLGIPLKYQVDGRRNPAKRRIELDRVTLTALQIDERAQEAQNHGIDVATTKQI